MNDIEAINGLGDQVTALERDLSGAMVMTTAFAEELRVVRGTLAETTTDLANLERGFSGGLRKAFDGLIFDGMKLSEALNTVATAMINTTYNAAMKPITDHLGGLLAGGVNSLMAGVLPFANGASFSQGRVMPFAKGGVVSGPATFAMRGGTGLMGEAGPEAIMPLSRGADGRLGVRAQGGGSVNITMNVSTPDVQGFQRSQGQISAQMARVLGRGQRNR